MIEDEIANEPAKDPGAVGGLFLIALAGIACCANTSAYKVEEPKKEKVSFVEKNKLTETVQLHKYFIIER